MQTTAAQPVVTGQVTEREYIAAHALARRKARRDIHLVLLVASAAGAILFAAGTHEGGFIGMCAAAGGVIGEVIHTRFLLPNKLRRLYAQSKDRVDVTYAWDDDNLFLTSKRGNLVQPWREFIKAKEDDNVVLLYLNDALFQIVAKRWFDDAATLDAFRTHLQFVR